MATSSVYYARSSDGHPTSRARRFPETASHWSRSWPANELYQALRLIHGSYATLRIHHRRQQQLRFGSDAAPIIDHFRSTFYGGEVVPVTVVLSRYRL